MRWLGAGAQADWASSKATATTPACGRGGVWRRAALASVALTALAVPVAFALPAAADPDAPGTGDGDPGVQRPLETRQHQASQREALVTRRAKRQAAVRADDTPLSVTIDQLTPSTLPEQGRIHVSGQVTNNDTETWRTITLRPVISLEPMVNAAQLDAAAHTPPDAVVGPRINVEPFRGFVAELAPGQTASYSFAVPRRLLEVSAPGVYWFSVHALGEGPDGRDALADGRARTFLPLVPATETRRQPTAVVIPLRRQLVHADDGSVDDLAGWTKALSDGGRLRSLVDFGASSGSSTVTWVVDPALVDAVRRLAAGNPGRSLAPNLESDEDDGETGESPSASATETSGADETGEPTPVTPSEAADEDGGSPLDLDSLDPVVQAAADAAQAWLSRLSSAIGPDDQVLTLPYGDVDVAGAVEHDPQLYQRAVARAATGLDGLDVDTAPALASPGGYLSGAAIDAADPDSTIVLTDAMFEAPAPAVASVDGREVVVASSGAADGGPGPDSRTGPTAMRQRLLAEAAVRLLHDDGGTTPLTVLLPHDWNPDDASSYFSGLDVPWLDLTDLDSVGRATTATPVPAAGLRYPGWQREAELDQSGFDSADGLIRAGAMLQNLLTLNNLVSGTVTDQALGTVSYSARTSPVANRLSADGSRRWIAQRLGRVSVSAPRAVTLSSSSGRFQATVTNGLDEPVTVALDAQSDDDQLLIEGPERVDVEPGGRQAVLLTARTDENGIHEVELLVTDKRGTPLGPRTELNIRSAQVSNVIWAFLGIGSALLFGAIAVRIYRRVRDARRTPAAADEPPATADAEQEPAGAGAR